MPSCDEMATNSRRRSTSALKGVPNSAAHGQGHDFHRLGQFAAGGKLAVIEIFRRFDVDTKGNGRQTMGLAAAHQGAFQIGQHLGRAQMSVRFVDHDLHVGVLQIGELHHGCIQRQIGKTSICGGDKHYWLLSHPAKMKIL